MTAPKRIGKYEISDQIGAGGFGVVYKAWDPYIQRWVALKTCAATDDEATQRFFREAQLAGALQHPNITLIFDFGIDDGIPYFVQEFLSGHDLDDLVSKKKMSLEGVLAILVQVCTGLEFAHSRGIVHRDIKPANVRVLEDGTVKIMDFGIAKSLMAESRLTQTGVALGTAGYLAPEQLSGKPLDARTDIFSLGVMTYELIGNVRPFTGPNISNVIYQILHQDPVPLTERNPQCSERLERAVAKALAKNQEDRWASVHDFGQELKEILAALSSRAQARRPETTTALVRGELARVATPSPSAAMAEIAAQPLEKVPSERQAAPAEEVAAAPARSRKLLWLLAAAAVAVAAIAYVLVGLGGGARSVATINPTPPLPTPAPVATPPPPVGSTSAAQPSTYSVTLFVDPVSEVEIDGRPLGKVQTTTLELTAGRHVVRQSIPDYTEKEHEIVVGADTRSFALRLPPYGLLSVLNDFGIPTRGTRVTLDGTDLGALPVRDRKVEAGDHRLVVVWPDGGQCSEQISVGAAAQVRKVVQPR